MAKRQKLLDPEPLDDSGFGFTPTESSPRPEPYRPPVTVAPAAPVNYPRPEEQVPGTGMPENWGEPEPIGWNPPEVDVPEPLGREKTAFEKWLEMGRPMHVGWPSGYINWDDESRAQYAHYLDEQSSGKPDPTNYAPVADGVVAGDLQQQIDVLQKMVSALLENTGGVKGRQTDRLMISVESERAKVEAALRMGLNLGELDLDEVKHGAVNVIKWLAEATGQPESKVEGYLRMTLASGASALTMVLSGGNFPLGAAAYFATQALLPKATTSSAGQTKQLFKGYQAEGTIDGQPVTALDVSLPMGLPHDIFGQYRFVVYDRLSDRWVPADEIEPLNYWSGENYRYVCLDRVTSKIYHSDKIKAVRLYV